MVAAKLLASLFWFAGMCVLDCIQAPAAIASVPPERGGVIYFSVMRCEPDKPDSAPETVRIRIIGSAGTTVAQAVRTWEKGDTKPIQWAANVPPGVYRYSLLSDWSCEMPGSVAVLPASVRPVIGQVWHHVTISFLPPLHVYGTLPPGYDVSVVRFSKALPCSANLSTAQGGLVQQLERDAIGYYAKDAWVGETVVLGIRVESGSTETRTFRAFLGSRPGVAVGTVGAIRFDITSAMIDEAFRLPANKLVCAGAASTT